MVCLFVFFVCWILNEYGAIPMMHFTWLELDLFLVDSKIALSLRILISWVHHVANRQAPYQVGMGYRRRATNWNISTVNGFYKVFFFSCYQMKDFSKTYFIAWIIVLFQIWMGQSIFHCDTIVRIECEHFVQ